MKKALASLLGFLCSFIVAFADNSDYVKVTSAPNDDWSGEYLIVYESSGTAGKAFDGSLTSFDKAKNTQDVTIKDGTIVSDSKYEFTIQLIDASKKTYSIKSASGYYIGNTSSSNGLASGSNAYSHTISSSNGTVYLELSSYNTCLKFNSNSSDMRFRYYKKDKQKAITLYKKVKVDDNREEINLTNFTADKTTLTKGEHTNTSVTNDQKEWKASYTYSSDKESVATVDTNGVITAVSKGAANIKVTANVASDDKFKAGTVSLTLAINVTNPTHKAQFSVNGTIANYLDVEEGTDIEFNDPTSIPEGQTFMGWTNAALTGTQESAPTYVTSATMGDKDVTFFAVFAKARTSGNANWVKKTLQQVVNNPELGDYALINSNGYAYNGTISSGHGQATDNAFVFTNDEATSAPAGTCLLTITRKKATNKKGEEINGIEITRQDNGNVIYATKAKSGSLNEDKSQDSYWYVNSSNLTYAANTAYLRTSGKSFRTYKQTSDGDGVVAFAYRPSITYTDYCTTVGGNVDTRKWVKFTNWTTEGGVLTLVKDNTLATVATLDPAACTSGSFAYDSSNPEVATIDGNGVITAVAKGEATLTATFSLAEDDADYRLSGDGKKTINITIVNTEHTVTFMADGKVVESNEVREEEAIVFPAVTAPTGLVFAGWSAQNWEGMQYTEPAWVNTAAAVMGETDLEFVAVFARVSQKGTEVKYSLTEEQIQEHFTQTAQAYGDEERSWNDESVTWRFFGQSVENGTYLQINSTSKESYIAFNSQNYITNIAFNILNGSSREYDNSLYIYDATTGVSVTTVNLNKVKEASIAIEGNHKNLSIQSGQAAKISNIVLTCVTPEQYAGYATSIAATEEIRTHVVTIADCGYTSVCLPYNAVAPEGAKFFALKSVDNAGLHFVSTDTLAAGQGYVLQGEPGEYTLTEVLEAVDYNANMLKGVVAQTNCVDLQLQGSGDYAYPWILAKDGTFKRYTGDHIPAGKAYLDGALLQNLQANQASALRIILEEDEVTALSQLHEEKATAPCFYNLQGQRVAQPRQAGALYIESNGRKIIVK